MFMRTVGVVNGLSESHIAGTATRAIGARECLISVIISREGVVSERGLVVRVGLVIPLSELPTPWE
jgi:hypothetical protein